MQPRWWDTQYCKILFPFLFVRIQVIFVSVVGAYVSRRERTKKEKNRGSFPTAVRISFLLTELFSFFLYELLKRKPWLQGEILRHFFSRELFSGQEKKWKKIPAKNLAPGDTQEKEGK